MNQEEMETELRRFRAERGKSFQDGEYNTENLRMETKFPSELCFIDFGFLLFHPEGHQIAQCLLEAVRESSRRAA